MSPSHGDRSTLPAELFDAILECVDGTADLLSMCLINSFVRDIALRHLYRSICLPRFEFLPTMRLCHVLVSRPALARYVVSLDIPFGNVPCWQARQWMPSPVFTATFGPAYYRLVFRAIRAMTNLKSINFVALMQGDSLTSENLALCAARGLTSLQYYDVKHIKHINPMLQTHPALTKLELVLSQDMDEDALNSLAELPSDALPFLHEVRCSKRFIPFLIPNRPVERVYIDDSVRGEEVRKCLESLSQSAHQISYLEFQKGVHPCELILHVDLAHFLPHLEELVVNGFHQDLSLLARITEPPALRVLQNLRYLRRLWFSCVFLLEESNLRVLATTLGTECATLRELTLVACTPVRSTGSWAAEWRYPTRSCTRNTSAVGPGGDWQFRDDFVAVGPVGLI